MSQVIKNPHLHIAVFALTAISFAAGLIYPYDRTWSDGATVYQMHTTWQLTARR